MTADEEASRLVAAGNDLEDRGLLDAAHEHYARAIAAAPAMPRPRLNLGNVLERMGRLDDAIAAAQSAISVAPQYAPAHFNVARLQRSGGRIELAEGAFREALRYDPALTEATLGLADILQARGRFADAIDLLRDAVASTPSHAGASYNLALALVDNDDLDEAATLLRRALEHGHDPGVVYGVMGNVCMRSGRLREAETWYRRKLARMPDSFEAMGALLFSLVARDDLTAQQVFAAHRELGARIDARDTPAPRAARTHARLRIGYVSGDFRRHAVALFIHPMLARHDRTQFEIFCYYNHRGNDAMTRELRTLAEHWRDIATLDDDAAADVVRRDDIDILVDLAGYTGESRLALFARRLAPVQATWLGYLHSTGMTATDYRICDAQTDPPGQSEQLHTEALVRMPHSQWCYEPAHHAANIVSQEHGESVVFGSFNQFWKMSERCLELWLEIVTRVPSSRVRFVGVPRGKTSESLSARIEAAGIDASRVSIAPRVDIDRYFEAIAAIDIALDTMPYNGATTTLDALWMGTPVVALVGDRSVARSGASILHTLGLHELVAASTAEYVDINVRLAQHGGWRRALRSMLRERLRASPLMDAAQFTRDLEARYVDMHAGSV